MQVIQKPQSAIGTLLSRLGRGLSENVQRQELLKMQTRQHLLNALVTNKLKELQLPDEYGYQGEDENRIFVSKRKGKVIGAKPAPTSKENEIWGPIQFDEKTKKRFKISNRGNWKWIDAQSSSSIPSPMKDFELTTYGKEVPGLRGTPGYQQKRLNYIRSQKEQSPYVDALNRQMEVTQKREGSALRKEFNQLPETKTYVDVKQKYEIMGEALKESKTSKSLVATDQALITLFNKMTDPESVVRESEYARTSSDLALWNRLKGKVEKLKAGGAGLTQEDRKALYKMGGKFMAISEKKYKSRLHEYKGYLTNYGLDPDKYLTPYSEKEADEYEAQPQISPEAENYLKSLGL